MVKKIEDSYECEECGLRYENRELAEQCEQWCKEHSSCNLEITQHAVNKNKIWSLRKPG